MRAGRLLCAAFTIIITIDILDKCCGFSVYFDGWQAVDRNGRGADDGRMDDEIEVRKVRKVVWNELQSGLLRSPMTESITITC